MDIVFVLGSVLLWGITVVLVMGFKRLEDPTRGQS